MGWVYEGRFKWKRMSILVNLERESFLCLGGVLRFYYRLGFLWFYLRFLGFCGIEVFWVLVFLGEEIIS